MAIVDARRARCRNRGGTIECGRPFGDASTHPVNADRFPDILEALRAKIDEIEIDLSGDPIADGLRDVDAARLGQRLEPRRNIDAVAENIATLDYDIVEIDPDAQRNAPVGQQRVVELRDRVAQSAGTAHGLDDALELDEHPVARPPDDMSAAFEDLRLDNFSPEES